MNSTNPLVSIDDDGSNEWDDFVCHHPLGTIYHLSGWKTVIEESFPHIKGKIITVRDRDSHEIIAGLPIYFVKSWLTGKRLVSVPFATLCDPLVSNADQFIKLFSAVQNLSKSLKAKFIEIRTFASGSLIRDKRLRGSLHYKNHYLELNERPDQLKKNFKRLCKRNITRCLKNNLRLIQMENESGLTIFYQLHMKNRKRLGLPTHPFKFFHLLWKVFSLSNQINILFAEKNETILGAMLLLKYKKRVSCEYMATDQRFKHFAPSSFLYWEAINLAFNEGFKIIDFGRTENSNQGLMEYKSRWGTKIVDLPKFYYPPSFSNKDKIRNSSLQYRIARKIFKYAPLKFSSTLGNFIYHHMG